MNPNQLSRIRIVLVEPHDIANLGGTARAMKNMGLSRLVLVRPKTISVEMAGHVALHATDLLRSASVVDTVEDAVRGSVRVYATTARPRRIELPVVSPRRAASEMAALAPDQEVSILFGSERNGLLQDDVEGADRIITILTAPEWSSLNLAQAVLVVAYELFTTDLPDVPPPRADLAPVEEIKKLERTIQPTIERLYAAEGYHPRRGWRSLRRIFVRAGLERRDVNVLWSLCKRLDRLLSL
jgi:TrmH family RNA methyltransferase